MFVRLLGAVRVAHRRRVAIMTWNFVADTPARSTRSALMSKPVSARLPRAPLQLVERQPGIEKRAEHHVAGDAGEAVEIQNARHLADRPISLKLQYRASPSTM